MDTSVLRPFRAVHRTDSLPVRVRLFEDVASRNLVIRLVWKTYERLRGTAVSRLMLGCYVLGSFLKLSVPRCAGARALAISVYPNEVQEVQSLRHLLDPLRLDEIKVGLLQALSPQSLRALTRLERKTVCRLLRIIARLERSSHFVASCRALSAIGFYARLKAELTAAPPPTAVAVASSTNPEALALVSLARKLRVPSIFSAHAALAPGSAVLPSTDIVLVDGPASLHRNTLPSHCTAIFKGLPGATRPLRLEQLAAGNPLQIGVFLSAPVNEKGLEATITALCARFSIKQIVIRPHPTAMLSPDLRWISEAAAAITLSTGVPLHQSMEGCDLVISGNSSVHLEVLKAGIPTVHSSELDLLEDDYYEFVKRGLVLRADPVARLDLSAVAAFYGDRWPERFCQFDPGYPQDAARYREDVRRQLRDALAAGNR